MLDLPKVPGFRSDGVPNAVSKLEVVNRAVDHSDLEDDDDERWSDDYLDLEPSSYSDLISEFDLDRFLPKADSEGRDSFGSPWHEPISNPEYLDRIDPQRDSDDEFEEFEFDELNQTDQFDELVDEIEAAVGDLLPNTPAQLAAIVKKVELEASKPKAAPKAESKSTKQSNPAKSAKPPKKVASPSPNSGTSTSKKTDPIRPTAKMTRSESNRQLAAAMRKRNINPNGQAWIEAKRLVANGATFEEAAAKCTRQK